MFSQTTEYALRAMACLASAPGELVPTTVLAAKTNVPANYLAKVLQQLASAGLIKGRRGVGGGYMLARDSSEINLLEVVRTVGELDPNDDPMNRNAGTGVGTLHTTLARVQSMVTEALEGVTLHSLVQTSGGSEPQKVGSGETSGR